MTQMLRKALLVALGAFSVAGQAAAQAPPPAALPEAPAPAGAEVRLAPVGADVGALKPPDFPIDYYDGLRAWEAGHREVAATLWLQGAALGDGRSMRRLGELFEAGDVMPAEPMLAAYYFDLAKRFGQGDAAAAASAAFARLSPPESVEVRRAAEAFRPALIRPPARSTPAATTATLVEAIAVADIPGIRALLGRRVSPGAADAEGWTPLMYAAMAGSAEIVDILVAANASPAAYVGDGRTALHIAAYVGSRPAVDALLRGGAHPAAATFAGTTAAYVARERGFTDLATFLLERERVQLREVQEKLNRLGYDVGAPDGVVGPRTRSNLAFVGHRFGLTKFDVLTAALLSVLTTATETRRWGYSYNYAKDGTTWDSWNFSVEAADRAAAEAAALSSCREKNGRNCRVTMLMPEGACAAIADNSRTDGNFWSRLYPSLEEAQAEALAACRRGGNASSCSILASGCAGR